MIMGCYLMLIDTLLVPILFAFFLLNVFAFFFGAFALAFFGLGLTLGLAGDHRFGRNAIDAWLGQSLLIGSVELANTTSDFSGPYQGEAGETFDARELFTVYRDVAIPVSEFRFRWTYGITERFSLGAGAMAAVWWDVAVAPGVIPGEDGNRVLHENTIVFVGATVTATYRF